MALLVRHPWRYVISRWNYKSAVMSAIIRGPIFFVSNLPAGLEAASGAMVAECLFRLATAGLYGAMTQAFRRVEPPIAATIAAMLLLPLVAHTGELLLHWLRGTPRLAESLAASIVFTVLSTSFNLFAMRRGALITGHDSRPLLHDLARMPALFVAFVMSWRSRRFI